LERAVLAVLVEQQVAEKTAHERPNDAENNCLSDAHRITSRDKRSSQEASHQSDE
jgi:hypothetical protein